MTSPAPVALITGASRGLGRAFAVAFAKKKYRVAVHYHANEAEAKKTAADIEAQKTEALMVKADVRSSSDVNAMVKQIEWSWGRVDVLVNNAGNVRDRSIFKMTDDEWSDVISTDLSGPFYCARAVLPLMRKQGGGSIVNITSYLAQRGARGAANYAAAKAGLVALTKSIALEEGGNRIRANAVLPGFHVTDLNRDFWAKAEKQIRDQHLLPEMPDLDEMGRFVTEIAELKTVTGQVFPFESRIL